MVYSGIPVAGVSYEGRQEILAGCNTMDMVTLEPDPANPFDPNAIRVLVDGQQAGFLPRSIAEDIARKHFKGELLAVINWVGAINGNYGMKLDIMLVKTRKNRRLK